MNGNANLNANNLTPQNVIDWRKKLGIGKTSLIYTNTSQFSDTTIILSENIDNFSLLNFIVTDFGTGNRITFTMSVEAFKETSQTNPLLFNSSNKDETKYQQIWFLSGRQIRVGGRNKLMLIKIFAI